MTRFTTNEAAKQLRTTGTSLVRYIKAGKIPAPELIKAGKSTIHSWTEKDIERVRKLLPKIANGRKTRYQKQKGKTQKPQPRASQPRHAQKRRTSGTPEAVPHKQRKKQK